MRRLLLLICLLPSLGGAQTVKIAFPDEAPRKVWVAASPSDPPPRVDSTSAKEVQLEVGSKMAIVLDEGTGNLAATTAKTSVWKVRSEDFKFIGEVHVEANPEPQTASFSCQGQTVLVSPGGSGSAVFYGLTPGKIEASVTYTEAGNSVTRKQSFELEVKRADPVPRLIIGLPKPPETPTPPVQGASKEPNNEMPGRGLLGTAGAILFVAALAVAVLYFGMKWIYANQDEAKSALKKLGVQVPDPLQSDPDADTPPDPAITAPVVMAPIVLPGDGPVSIVDATALGIPKLSGPAGVFELSEGVHVIGREPGLTISLVGESSVSRRHAEIACTSGHIVVRDLGSTNGTFVNGQPVTGDATLHIGDTVRFGAVQMQVVG